MDTRASSAFISSERIRLNERSKLCAIEYIFIKFQWYAAHVQLTAFLQQLLIYQVKIVTHLQIFYKFPGTHALRQLG